MESKNNTAPGTEAKPPVEHVPVMLKEVLDLLQVGNGKNFVDGTLGLGGHAEAILNQTSPEGRLLGIDRDPKALIKAKERLKSFGDRVRFAHGTFERASEFLQELGWDEVDGMLLDLGVSSMQLNDPERGFSFLKDSALDMRMDLEEEVTARELLNSLPESELAAMFRDYGEERFSKRIAHLIFTARRQSPIGTTGELANLVSRAVPFYNAKIHPATRVFQALRIAVNRELNILQKFLSKAPEFIKIGGRLVVISYHSLEDRIVKYAFRSFETYQILTKKPLRPDSEEVRKNPRARSAKLRVIQRTE